MQQLCKFEISKMIGVLALQGAFLEHLAKFAQLGVPAKEVRNCEAER